MQLLVSSRVSDLETYADCRECDLAANAYMAMLPAMAAFKLSVFPDIGMVIA